VGRLAACEGHPNRGGRLSSEEAKTMQSVREHNDVDLTERGPDRRRLSGVASAVAATASLG